MGVARRLVPGLLPRPRERLKQVACSIDATTFDAATGFGSRVVYESSVKVGFQLRLVGSLTSLVAGAAVAALHYPDASATVDAAKVVPADVTKVEPATARRSSPRRRATPLDAKSPRRAPAAAPRVSPLCPAPARPRRRRAPLLAISSPCSKVRAALT